MNKVPSKQSTQPKSTSIEKETKNTDSTKNDQARLSAKTLFNSMEGERSAPDGIGEKNKPLTSSQNKNNNAINNDGLRRILLSENPTNTQNRKEILFNLATNENTGGQIQTESTEATFSSALQNIYEAAQNLHDFTQEHQYPSISDTSDTSNMSDMSSIGGVLSAMIDQRLDGNKEDFDDFKQGSIGDCALLSTINALNQDPDGQKILDDAVTVTVNQDGQESYDVALYNDSGEKIINPVSQAEIDAARAAGLCSDGDDQVAAIELAAKKFFGSDLANGMPPHAAFAAIIGSQLGPQAISIYSNNNLPSQTSTAANSFKSLEAGLDRISEDPDGAVAAFSCFIKSDGTPVGFEDPARTSAHVLSVVSYDATTQNITYVNPWDTSNTHTISKSELMAVSPFLFVANADSPTLYPGWTILKSMKPLEASTAQ